MLIAKSLRVVSLSGTTHRMGEHLGDRRLLEAIRNIPPVEAKQRYYAMLDCGPLAA